MADPQFTFGDRVTTVGFDATILAGGGLQLCLLQLAPNLESIGTDAGRPAAVRAVEDLLIGGGAHHRPALAEMAPGAEAVLVVAPEFAFGSSDWSSIDAAVRQAGRPLVLLGGFGVTPGQNLLDWRAAAQAGGTGRHFAWDEAAAPLSTVRPVNGGWCWVHDPNGDTHCIVFLKIIAEQNVEAVQLPALQYGRRGTYLRFNDLDLFPLICADMLQPMVQHPDSPQARIREAVVAGDVARPAMVVGSLLQTGYNINWEIAVDGILNQVLAGREGVVALCNIAHDHPVADEAADRWRSLSGVYGRWGDLTKGQANLPVGRRLSVRGVVGGVLRQSGPTVATGKVSWGPYGPVDGKFIWHAEMHGACSAAGVAAPVLLPNRPDGCELSRFVRRHPAQTGWSPRVATGLKLLATQLTANTPPSPERLLHGLLAGVAPDAVDPDELHKARIAPAAMAAVHGLAVVATIEGLEWLPNNDQAGQLRSVTSESNILIWRDPNKTVGQMERELGAWKVGQGHHPNLVVIGASWSGDLKPGIVEEGRLDDVAAPPSPAKDLGAVGGLGAEAGDITLARGRCKVATLGLDRVAAIYADYDPALGDQEKAVQLLADINAFFEKGAAA